MKISVGWLKEFLGRTMSSDVEVVRALERAGIETEQVISSSDIDKRIVVGLVKKVVQHPEADRLKLAEVETDEGVYQVVCGAPNVRQGLKVAFAQIGTTLPSGDRIEKVKLRGEASEGMLCSEFELNLSNDHNGILELSTDLALGTPLCDVYPKDTMVDVKTPANRFDVQSVIGLAREVAAMTLNEAVPLAPPPVKPEKRSGVLDDGLVAQRYMLARLKVAQPAHSPLSVAARLRAAGTRSIGPVVDVTNYVMLETGQPLHAFDAAKVTLPIAVRRAHPGEVLVTLDGVRRELTEEDLIIADAKGPIGLAGLMGGQGSEVSADTTEILLEAAVFDGVIVRKMAQRHGLRTEASARFERGLPVVLPPLGLARAVQMLREVAGGELQEVVEHVNAKPQVRSITLPVERLVKLLGFGISHKEAVAALAKLQISAEAVTLHKDSEGIHVPEVPWWRPDLKEPEDLVEEIVRVIGYDKVPATIPSWRPRHITFDRVRTKRRQVRDVLWAAGAFEVMTYSFVSAEQLTDLGYDTASHLKLKNPLSSEQAYLRSSLLPSHVATLERNRMYAKAVRFYELSNVFLKRGKAEQPDEPLRLGLTVLDPAAAYATAKGILDGVAAELNVDLVVRPGAQEPYAPGRYGEIWLGEVQVGGIGQLHPDLMRRIKIDSEAAYAELDLTTLLLAATTRHYSVQSAFPTIVRDVTGVLPQTVTWQAVKEATAEWDASFVGDYHGPELPAGMKRMTIRLRLSLPDRTPTDAEASELEETVLRRLGHAFRTQTRG